MSEIVVIASMRAKAGKEAATRDALLALAAPTHDEDGCLMYAFHQHVEDPTRFAFVERWASQQLMEAHLGSAHIAAVLEVADDLLDGSPEIAVYQALPAGQDAKGSIAGHAAG